MRRSPEEKVQYEKERHRRYRELNREKIKLSIKRRYDKNPTLRREQARLYRELHPNRILHSAAKMRARRKGLCFSLTWEDCNIPTYCPILGIKLEGHLGRLSDDSPSLDRIIPEKGYIKDNVWVISNRANRIKNDATLEELKQIVAALEAKCSAGR